MNSKFLKSFNTSAGFIFLAMAIAHFIGNQGEATIQPPDPIFDVSSRYLFWILAGVEMLVAIVCLFTKLTSLKTLSIFWLTSNLLIYRLFLYYFGVHSVRAYYSTMAYSFGVSVDTTNVLMALLTAYIWLGSGLSLFMLRKKSNRNETAAQAETSIVQA
jgi:hypothetical protein